MPGPGDRHGLTPQQVYNLTWDNTYDVIAIAMMGYDSAGVLRRVAVTENGYLKVVVGE